ncbi:MAG: hypothetical protein ACR2QH_15910 [Geminicoccaceae bacterium]
MMHCSCIQQGIIAIPPSDISEDLNTATLIFSSQNVNVEGRFSDPAKKKSPIRQQENGPGQIVGEGIVTDAISRNSFR